MIYLFKKFLKRTPIYPLLLEKIIDNWQKMGKPGSSSDLIKQKTVQEYADKFALKILIETGTYLGDMVFAMKNTFRQIYSIELDTNLCMRARKRFVNSTNIHIIEGDSSSVLPDILASIKYPCLFWLDGHYSGGITARGNLNTPIREELKHILVHSIKDHVILIDDARCFAGQKEAQKDYPTIEDLRGVVAKKRPNWIFEVRDDIIRIHKFMPGYYSKK